MGADESSLAATRQQSPHDFNRPPTRQPVSRPAEPSTIRSPHDYNRPATSNSQPVSRPAEPSTIRSPNNNTRPPISQPVSRPAEPSIVRYREIQPYGSYTQQTTTNPTSTSSNINIDTRPCLPYTPARSNVSQNASSSSSGAQPPTSGANSNVNINTKPCVPPTPARSNVSQNISSSPSGTQTSTSSANAARCSTPPVTPDRIYPTLQNVETESRHNAFASYLQPSNMQSNLQQTRSVEENVKNFDDMPQFPTQRNPPSPQASELLNVPSTSSATKMKQAQTKNLHNKGIGKHKGPKKNVQGNKAEFARSTISEIENGFNLVTLQENNKTGNANRADRTQIYRNKAQHNGLSQDSISCPICMDPMLGMVYQCLSGHTICDSCYDSLPRPVVCPSCRMDMAHPVRNRALEDLISKMKIPCVNNKKGCIFSLPASNLRDHLDECIYRTMSCPIGNILGCCFWKGNMQELKEHFNNSHPDACGFEPDVEMTVQNVNVDARMVNLIVLGNFNFLLHVKVDIQKQRTYWLIQNVGTKNAAKNWTYEFHFYNKSEPRRKVFYAESCSSDSESTDAIFESLHCAVLPYDVLRTFFNAGKLNYKFFIRKTDKERNRNNDDDADPSENRKNCRKNYKKQ